MCPIEVNIVPARLLRARLTFVRNLGRLCMALQLVSILKPTCLPHDVTVADKWIFGVRGMNGTSSRNRWFNRHSGVRGFGMPAAIALKVCRPTRFVMCLVVVNNVGGMKLVSLTTELMARGALSPPSWLTRWATVRRCLIGLLTLMGSRVNTVDILPLLSVVLGVCTEIGTTDRTRRGSALTLWEVTKVWKLLSIVARTMLPIALLNVPPVVPRALRLVLI